MYSVIYENGEEVLSHPGIKKCTTYIDGKIQINTNIKNTKCQRKLLERILFLTYIYLYSEAIAQQHKNLYNEVYYKLTLNKLFLN